MPRARKAVDGQVVRLYEKQIYGVVVEYRATPSPRYLIVRTDPLGRNPYGQPIWIESTEFEPEDRYSKTPGIIHRKNKRLEEVWDERPCKCQCCEH